MHIDLHVELGTGEHPVHTTTDRLERAALELIIIRVCLAEITAKQLSLSDDVMVSGWLLPNKVFL